MSKKRKKFLVTTDNSEAFACSLVTSPAVEETFVAFNEEKPFVEKFADEKKHLVTGVVAIPNKPIYRRNADGEEYDIVFSAEAIEKMSRDFLKNYKQHEVTLQHQENADGVYLVEQWIKTDMVYDKSISVGLSRELPVGSWIQTYYVDSHDVWSRIESGELLGFSLECVLGLQEFEEEFNKIENNMEIQTDEMGFWNKMKEVLKEAFGKAEKEELAAESGFTNVEDYNKEVEAIKEELEEETPPAVETPTVETPAVEEPTVEEPTEEAPKVEEPTEEVQPQVDDNKHLEELINSLKDEINALKELNGGLKKKVKELEKEPSSKPINTNAKGGGNSNNGVNSSSYQAWREQMRGMIG
jgi:hypothetical protein